MSLAENLDLAGSHGSSRQKLVTASQTPPNRIVSGNTRLPGGSLKLAILFVLGDLIGIALGFGLGALASDGVRIALGLGEQIAGTAIAEQAHEIAFLTVLTIGVFSFGGLYRRAVWEMDEVRCIIMGVGLVALVDTMLQFTLRDHSSRLWFFLAYPIMAFSIISVRMWLRELRFVSEAATSHVMLLGSGTTSTALMFEMRNSQSDPVELLGQLGFSEIDRRNPERLVQMLDRLARNADATSGRVLTVLAPTADEIPYAQQALAMLIAAKRPCSIILPFEGLARRGLSLQKAIGTDLVMAEVDVACPSAEGQLLKRTFDLVAGTLAVVLLSPVLLVLSLLLIAEKRGPVLFRQPRVGKDGRTFQCYKFRSMLPDAQERLEYLLATDPAAKAEWDRTQKLQNDPRITKTGKFLRTTSLDELPQLFNVLTGDMSLVGPRPIIAPDVPGYPGDRAYFESPDFAHYKSCMPGITGLWQVSGRSTTSHEERVRLDRWYSRNWSFWLDLVILLRTVSVVLFRKGSA